jgi:hypothetical protein
MEPKRHVSRDEMARLCLEKALEVVDAVNAVQHCKVFKVLKAEPLYEGTGAIRLDITFQPPCPRD